MQGVHLVHPSCRPAVTGVGLVLDLPDGRGGPRSLPEPGLGRGVGAVQDLAVEGQLGLQLLQVVAAVEGLGGLRENQQESVCVYVLRGSLDSRVKKCATHVIPEGRHLPEADPPGAADEVGRVIRVGDASVSVDRHVGATKEGIVIIHNHPAARRLLDHLQRNGQWSRILAAPPRN